MSLQDGLPPSPAEELERKITETLMQLQADLQQRKVSLTYAQGALRAVWACASGLTDRVVMDAVSEFTNAIEATLMRKPAVDQMATLQSPAGALTVVVRRGSHVTLSMGAAGTKSFTQPDTELLPFDAAAKLFDQLVERFKSNGHTVLPL